MKYGARCDFIPRIKACTSSPSFAEAPYFDSLGDALSIDDLELFHHYHISTCFTFSTEPLVRGFWQLAAPRLGFSAPYILRGILAVSALHLSRLRKHREGFYLSRAFKHFDLAFEMAVPFLGDISASNCEQIFVFSVLSKIVALAKPKDDSDLLLANQQLVPEWLGLLRSTHEAVGNMGEAKQQPPGIAVILDKGPQAQSGWFVHGNEKDAIDELETNVYNSLSKDLDALAAVVDALDRLRHSFVLFNDGAVSGESQVKGTIGWLRRISDAYITLVADGNYEALCVLAFYCVPLRRLEFIWWIEGWGFHLIDRIYSHLPVKYRLWIRWPIQEIGWAPP